MSPGASNRGIRRGPTSRSSTAPSRSYRSRLTIACISSSAAATTGRRQAGRRRNTNGGCAHCRRHNPRRVAGAGVFGSPGLPWWALPMQQSRFMWIFLFAPLLAGCGGATIDVRGRVLLDGAPVDRAAVTLVPVGKGHPASGITEPDGSFRLMTFKKQDGALPGEYKVIVTRTDAIPPPPDATPGDPDSIVNHYKELKSTRI